MKLNALIVVTINRMTPLLEYLNYTLATHSWFCNIRSSLILDSILLNKKE